MNKLLVILSLFLVIAAYGLTNNTSRTGVKLKTKIVVEVTMDEPGVYQLWGKQKLTDPWAPMPAMEKMTVGTNAMRVSIEGAAFDHSRTYFFDLRCDGATVKTNDIKLVITNNTAAVKAPPTLGE